MTEEERDAKISAMHDSFIRLEPFMAEVEKNRKWREGNGIPGAKFQLWTMWCIFLALSTIIIRRF